jgi:type I restriction enzyme M protein
MHTFAYPSLSKVGLVYTESRRALKRLGKDPKKLFLYGQELNDDTWAMSKMNVFLHDMEAQIAQGDTFVNPKFLEGGARIRVSHYGKRVGNHANFLTY